MTNGTFSICADCPADGNCCSRVHTDRGVDAPIVFSNEIAIIENVIGTSANAFSMPDEISKFRRLKSTSSGCIFFRGGKCEIYSIRPIDCRLFPLDIGTTKNGKLVWIAYCSVCPEGFDPLPLLSMAREFLRMPLDDLFAYASAKKPLLDCHEYVELAELTDLDLAKIAGSTLFPPSRIVTVIKPAEHAT